MATQLPIQEVICGHRVHPAAAMFPLLDGEQFEELKADIRQNGQQQPALRTESGELLDGRNRLRAVEKLQSEGFQVEPKVVVYEGDLQPHEFVISANIHRRHLTKTQRAQLAAKLYKQFEKEAEEARLAGSKKARSKTTEPKRRDHASEAARSTTGRIAKLAGTGNGMAKAAVKVEKAVEAGELPESASDEIIAGKITPTEALSKRRPKQVADKQPKAAKPAKAKPAAKPKPSLEEQLLKAVQKRWSQMKTYDKEWGIVEMPQVRRLFVKVIKEEIAAEK